ncbi:hypothetical protein [Devosia sp.]|uniref:hypothetical protein n=1 Tax=Devosia sp. TaxID=1871048 RepID=UPI0032657A4F
MLRADLEAHRNDLAAARHTEVSLRDELRIATAGLIDRAEHLNLKAQFEALAVMLVDEKTRNAELHAQILRIMGTIVRSEIDSAATSVAPE